MIVSLFNTLQVSDCCLTTNVQFFSYINFMSLVLPDRGSNPLFEASTKLIIYTINAVNVVSDDIFITQKNAVGESYIGIYQCIKKLIYMK